MASLTPEQLAAYTPPEKEELIESGFYHEAQRELMKGEHGKIVEEMERWEELAPADRELLAERVRKFDEELSSMMYWIKRLGREKIEKIKKAKRELERREEEIARMMPKPWFNINETVSHRTHGRGTVVDVRWDEGRKTYMVLVDFGPERIWVPQEELMKIAVPPKVPAPPVEKPLPPKPPVPKAPAVPRPKPAIEVGEFVEHKIHGKGRIIESRWNDALGKWEYKIKFGG